MMNVSGQASEQLLRHIFQLCPLIHILHHFWSASLHVYTPILKPFFVCEISPFLDAVVVVIIIIIIIIAQFL